jgi:hypothetical protein
MILNYGDHAAIQAYKTLITLAGTPSASRLVAHVSTNAAQTA